MKKQLLIPAVLISLIFCACRNSDKASAQLKKEETDKAFYPIGNYIYSQLKYIDSMPLAVIKYTTLHNSTDTSIVEKVAFKKIAEAFITPDISSPQLNPQYEETSFIDATLGTITLTYVALNNEAEIRKADILLNHENTNVKTIYIERSISNADSAVLKKLLWTNNRNCQITSLIQKKGQPEEVILEKYVWDDKE